MYEKVFAYLDAHAEDYAAQLCRWVEVPSVKGEATPDAPFGKDVRRMLDVAMADAKAFGYETRDFDGYACDITLPGESEEAIAVLGHLDVVPAGDNWATLPFTATRVGDQIFARGTSDDKGPALAALYAMNAIKAAGIPLKKSIRLILGCDEESDWEDMAYYCAHTEMPEVGFSPDASFPIINTEKGMIHGFFTSKLAEDGLQVKQLWTGERVNVIPGESKALIAGGQEVADKVAAYAEKTGLPYTAEVTADGVWLGAMFCLSRFVITHLSGGYGGGVPPLPIPNREVKPACADGTAMQCGRVGGRPLSTGEPSSIMLGGSSHYIYMLFLVICRFVWRPSFMIHRPLL